MQQPGRPYSKWEFSNELLDKTIEMSDKNGYSRILNKLLENRNMLDENEIEKFLNPAWENLHDPFLLIDLDKGAKRLKQALENKEDVLVYGDYDADGVSATSLLCSFINKNGGKARYLIPDRFSEGYGLTFDALNRTSEFPDLLITVDCGINSVEEVEWLNENGTDVIITDHHEQLGDLPPAIAVINPKRKESDYPFKELSGVGVCLKLVWAVLVYQNNSSIREELEFYLDLVALGTIADLVPLVDENRFFVIRGLKNFGQNRTGLKALTDIAGLNDQNLNVGNIAFVIAPRINAAGRLESGELAVKLLLEESSYDKAYERADYLSKENDERRELEKKVFEEAREEILKNDYHREDYVIVVGKEDWHEGVIGIAASKILEEFYQPVVLLTIDGDEAKGSCRSISSFNMVEGLSKCEDLLKKYGGHKLAAGLTLETCKIDIFREKLNDYAREKLSSNDLIPSINVDISVPACYITDKLVEEIDLLAPFGIGNPKPVLSSVMKVDHLQRVGKNKEHVKLSLYDGQYNYDGIWFNAVTKLPNVKKDSYINVAYTPKINNFNQKKSVDLQIVDIKHDECEKIIEDYRNCDKRKVLEKLKEGSTFLVNTKETEKVLRSNLNKIKNKKENTNIVKFNNLSNTVIKSDTLILFDLPFDGEALRKNLRKMQIKKIYLLYCNEDKNKNDYLWKASIPTKDKLIWVYNRIFHLNNSSEIDIEEIKKLFIESSFPGTTWRLINKCLDIFTELDVLKENNNSYMIKRKRKSESLEQIDFNVSKTYKQEKNRLTKINWWEDKFLNSPAALIYQIFFDDMSLDLLT
ncbi:single-stranded-DNA-specific exonuclease RecJ [Natranaerofaba carboxydovora]|uniref:single-stranded-DNA-specific exonuclease RecJ n=1 Tax=Natranaerofaba carboxydovora TaxID=2742683 RepID=UPI001F128D91|nr:single-stranded-DNA-specific exonuclease RecJ [Natranaerofaba carboxydovora]UMZ73242.1 Single-stranded-DNA-specific exonuclease RecJ [Natranaerofaba carboxydovora]